MAGRDVSTDPRGAPSAPTPGTTLRRVERHGALEDGPAQDAVAVEEPLEIRLASDPLAITMRTPGEDRLLAVGFLFAEGVIERIEDVGRVAHCGRPTDEGFGNVIDVLPAPGATLEPARLEGTRRGTLTTASCGVCGRRSIEDLLERIEPIERAADVPLSILRAAPSLLEAGQHRFRRTGGVHAAAILDPAGRVGAHAEDVGRHNAVDKVVGRLLYEGGLGTERASVLAVSGRVSFEIVQKAAAAGVPVVVGVSAATSLAIDLAERAGVTLAAFARGGRVNLYTHARRVRPDR